MRGVRASLCLLAWVMLAVVVRGAGAQQTLLPAAGAAWDGAGGLRSGHGWAMVMSEGAGVPGISAPYVLMHLPPRDAEGRTGAGVLWPVARLPELPEALGATASEVYLVFRPTRAPGGELQRRVARVRALMGIGGTWAYTPSEGVEAATGLPGDGMLVTAGGTSVGPAVVLRDGSAEQRGPGPARLMVLRGVTWHAVALPEDAAGAGTGWMGLCATREGAALAWIKGDGRLTVAMGRLESSVEQQAETVSAAWRVAAEVGAPGWGGGETGMGVRVERRLLWADGQVVLAVQRGDAPIELWAIEDGGAAQVATLQDARMPAALVSMDGVGRVAAVFVRGGGEPAADPDSIVPRPAAKTEVMEVSIFSGRVMFAGAAGGKLFSAWQLQVLMVAVGAMMVTVLMFVLRSESGTVLPVPRGLALAPPGRRLAAAVVDGVLALLASSIIHGVAPLKILSPALLAKPLEAWGPLATAVGIAVVGCALLEAWTGRTLGKRMLGLGVVGVRRAGAEAGAPEGSDPLRVAVRVGDVMVGRPTLWQALVRNAVRWVAPPLAALVLFDANWRHPGDVLGRTMVLTGAEEEAVSGGRSED